MIRICKILPVAKGLENWGALHEELLREIASNDVAVTQVDLPDVGVTSIGSCYEADLVAPAHTQAALRAEAEGFDAVVMGCLLEPGVSAAKEALRIPVVGEAGAAMHLAALVAQKFSLLVPGTGPGGADRRLRELAQVYGLAERLASVRRVQSSSLAFTGQMPPGLIEAMLRAATSAVTEDGAEAIIGYGGLNVYRALRHDLPVPVISPIQASVIVAEMLVRSRLAQSKVAFARPSILE